MVVEKVGLETVYHLAGIIASLFLILVIIILRKENQDVIKSRIFLRYNQFKNSFYALFIGAIIFLIGSLIGFVAHEELHFLHDLTEVLFNAGIGVFAIMLYLILRTKKQGE